MGENPPTKKPGVTGEGYCEWRRGVKSAGVVLTVPEGMSLSQYDVSSPNGDISCDQVQPDLWVCYGEAVKPDSNVALTICPDCQPGYYFNQDTGICQPLPTKPSEVDLDLNPICEPDEFLFDGQCFPLSLIQIKCDEGYWYQPPCGCLPLGTYCAIVEEPPDAVMETQEVVELVVEDSTDPDDGNDGGFPAESFFDVLVELEPKPGQLGIRPDFEIFPLPGDCDNGGILTRCPPTTIPWVVDGCRTCIPLRTIPEPDCPEGYFYDEVADCCIPETPIVTCPWWTYYDPVAEVCKPIVFEKEACFDLTIYVPDCGPQPRPTPEPGCKNPDQYSTQSSCEEALCKWELLYPSSPGRGGTCVMP